MSIRDRVKKTKVKHRNNKMKTYGIYVSVSLIFLIGFFGVISYANKYKKEVQILSFNESLVDSTLVEESLMSPLTLSEMDMKEGMIRWDDREEFTGKYSAHFIREGTPTYTDMFAEEQALRTPYLYNLESDQELLTFPYSISEAGGKLVTPGDRLRIRGSYVIPEDEYNSEIEGELDEEDIKENHEGRTVADIIFDVVEVQDLLNSSNESIVDIINSANRLSQSERELLMSSDEFINKVTPSAVLMVVDTEEVDKYVEFQANEAPTYTITMLSRNEELQTNELNTGNSLWNLLEQVKVDQGVTELD